MHHEVSNKVSSSVDSYKTFVSTGMHFNISSSFGKGFPLIKLARHQVQFHTNYEDGSWETVISRIGWIAPVFKIWFLKKFSSPAIFPKAQIAYSLTLSSFKSSQMTSKNIYIDPLSIKA